MTLALALLACTPGPEVAAPGGGSPARPAAADTALDTATDTGIDTADTAADTADTAPVCGGAAPELTADLSFDVYVLDPPDPGTITHTLVSWTLSAQANDADGDLDVWALELWWGDGGGVDPDARPPDDVVLSAGDGPTCAAFTGSAGLGGFATAESPGFPLVQGAPYAVAVVAVDASGMRSAPVILSGVTPAP